MNMLIGYESPLQRQLRDDAQRRKEAMHTIRSIARDHGVTYDEIISRTRGSETVANARHHAMAVIRWSTAWSLKEIARVFHRTDHTTVLAAERKWAAVLEKEYAGSEVPSAPFSLVRVTSSSGARCVVRVVHEDRPAIEDALREALPSVCDVEREAYPDPDLAVREALPLEISAS